jgi:iron complex outermembrane receptor protein
MWKQTLVAAAVASVAVTARAAEEAPPPPRAPETPPPDGSTPAKTLKKIRVEDTAEAEGLKAKTQTSSSKLELTLRETPQSVTVITQESLKDRQVTDFGQALELSAGVSQYSGTGPFGGQAGFGFNETAIRGISIDSLNDVRDDGFINTTYFAIPDTAIYDRIEVIKGPNSVVYGRGSAGGLINRIRKKPDAQGRTDLELTAGAFDTYRLDVDATGALNADDSISGRVVGAYADEGSFVDGVERKRTLVAPSLDIGFDTGTRVLFEGLFQRDDFKPNPGIPLVGEPGGRFHAPNISRSLYVGVPNRTDNRWNIYTGSVQVDQSLGDRWLATLRLNKNRTESPIAVDSYSYGLSDTGDTLLLRNRFTIDRDIWAGELRLGGTFDVAGRAVQIATGAEFSDNDYHRRGEYAYLGYANIYARDFLSPPADLPLSPGFEYRTHDKVSGYYLQAQVRPIDRLSVLTGFRFDRADSEYTPTGGEVARKKDDDVTGRIGVTYDLTQNVSLYGVYAQSYSPVLFSVDQNGEILDPETGDIVELGLKTEWFDQRLGVNAALYRIDREHIPVSVPTLPGVAPYSISSGLQRSEGFEIEVNGQPLPGWNISGAYNRLDSEFKDPRDLFFGAKPGGSADWQVGLYSSYELQSGALKGFSFGATVFAIDDRGLSSFERGSLDGYTRVDLNFAYKGLPDYEFLLSVRNIFDERYIEGADRSGAIAMFGSPPAWLLTMRRHFGN